MPVSCVMRMAEKSLRESLKTHDDVHERLLMPATNGVTD